MNGNIPTLTTERLTLRGPTVVDLDVYSAFNAVSELSVGKYRGGKPADEIRDVLKGDIAHWQKGYGMWMITLAGDQVIGGVGLVHPDDWPRHELTWWLMPDQRGHGYATEASRAVINFGYEKLGWPQVETHMRDENLPARKLAQRLGGKFTGRDTFPDGVARDVFALPRSAQEDLQ
ncbi:MAG: GNAT family N-acetyltransferase [Paracoccaceae bacterium]